jgi:hypothetical protein
MRERMSRRWMLGLVASVLGIAAGPNPVQAEGVSSQATCSWRRVSSWCSGGITQEYWCYRCCDSSGCTNVRCETRPTGAC